jgi:hypothetical protein
MALLTAATDTLIRGLAGVLLACADAALWPVREATNVSPAPAEIHHFGADSRTA